LDGIQAVIQEVRSRAVDGLARATAEGVIGHARGETRSTDARQLVPGIPCIGGGHAGIGAGSEIAIQVIGLGGGTKCRLLVIRIVSGGRERRRQIGAGERPDRLESVSGPIIRIGQGPQRRRALLVRHRREFGGGVIRVLHLVGVGIRDTGSSIRIIIGDRDRAGALDDGRESIRIVVGIRDLWLADDGHGRPAGGVVVRLGSWCRMPFADCWHDTGWCWSDFR